MGIRGGLFLCWLLFQREFSCLLRDVEDACLWHQCRHASAYGLRELLAGDRHVDDAFGCGDLDYLVRDHLELLLRFGVTDGNLSVLLCLVKGRFITVLRVLRRPAWRLPSVSEVR